MLWCVILAHSVQETNSNKNKEGSRKQLSTKEQRSIKLIINNEEKICGDVINE